MLGDTRLKTLIDLTRKGIEASAMALNDRKRQLEKTEGIADTTQLRVERHRAQSCIFDAEMVLDDSQAFLDETHQL